MKAVSIKKKKKRSRNSSVINEELYQESQVGYSLLVYERRQRSHHLIIPKYVEKG